MVRRTQRPRRQDPPCKRILRRIGVMHRNGSPLSHRERGRGRGPYPPQPTPTHPPILSIHAGIVPLSQTDDTLPLRPPIPNPYSESRQAIRPELATLAGNANNKANTVSGRQRPSRLSSRMAVRRLHPPYSTGIRQTAQRESPPPRAALPRFHQPVARGTRKPRTNLSARKNSVGPCSDTAPKP